MTDPLEIRIGDADREHLANLLGQHFAMGRLTMSEYQERLDAIYAARTRVDTTDLLADLPTEPTPTPDDGPTRRLERTPRTRWTPWALTGALCLLVWIITSLVQGRPLAFWPGWVIGPWGIALLARRHASLHHHTQ